MQGSSHDGSKRTPRALFNFLNRRYHFDYDAMASHANALCDTYSTIEGTFSRAASVRRLGLPYRKISDGDGLTFPWEGRRVFLNPDYSRGIFRASIDKMIAERDSAEIIVGLLKSDTSTALWRAIAAVSDVTFLPRIRFEGETSAASFTNALVVVRPSLGTIPTK